MLAGAIGDAMGGPVEGWSWERIAETHGIVDSLLPYPFSTDYHNQFSCAPGTVTDDTRLKHRLVEAILLAEGLPRRGDLIKVIVSAYHAAETDLERGFLEEYAQGGLYGEDKLIWGGQMTNGFLMANAPIGMICPCDPQAAFEASFAVDYISDGYAKYSAALGAAAVAAAFIDGATPYSVIQAALDAAASHRKVGNLTSHWQWYDQVFELNERLIHKAVEIADVEHDVFALCPKYYEAFPVNGFGSEAGQTVAVAFGMLVAAQGDLEQTILGCVNYGRDNDSYATVAGAIAGAMRGSAAIPAAWAQGVLAANPEPDMALLSEQLARVALRRYERMQNVVSKVNVLI